MNRHKQNFGPEFPADLQWSQGAKNTWKNNGTSADDTNNYGRFSRAPNSETIWTSQYDGQRVLQSGVTLASRQEGNAPRASKGETTSALRGGPPKGDTNKYYPSRDIVHSQTKESSMVQSVMNMNEEEEGWANEHSVAHEHSISWYIELVKSKHYVIDEFKKGFPAVAVNCSNDSGFFSSEERTKLTNEIMIQLFKYEVPDIPKAFVPKFCTYKDIQGLLVFLCFDIKTAQWLTTLNFNKLWKGAKVEIFIERDFSNLILCRVSIPEPILDSKEIFHILKLQNKDICTNRWRLMERTDKNSEVQLNIAIDKTSLANLRESNMHLHYGVGKVEFHILDLEFSQFSSDFSNDNIINPKQLETYTPSQSNLAAKKSQATSGTTLRNTNISQKDYLESLRNINQPQINIQETLSNLGTNIEPVPRPRQSQLDRRTKPQQDYTVTSRSIEPSPRPQQNYTVSSRSIERNPKSQVYSPPSRSMESTLKPQKDYSGNVNTPFRFSSDHHSRRESPPKVDRDRYYSPKRFDQSRQPENVSDLYQLERSGNFYRSESPSNLYRSESPRSLHRSESPRSLHRSESPRNLHRSESPRNLHRSESPRNLHRSVSPRDIYRFESSSRPREIYHESKSPPRSFTNFERYNSPAKDYSNIYADPYTERTDYNTHSDPSQRPISPNYNLFRDRSSSTHRYPSPLRYQDRSSPRYRDEPRLSRSPDRIHITPPRSRDRSPPRARERSPPRTRIRSPPRTRVRSPPRARERSPPRASDRSSLRYRNQSRRSRSPNWGRARSPLRLQDREVSPPRSRGGRYRSPDRRGNSRELHDKFYRERNH